MSANSPIKCAGKSGDDIVSNLTKATLEKLGKLGIRSAFNLVLHLPLRYEDETHLYRIKDAPHGTSVLIEAEVIDAEIKYRPKRSLICQVKDASGELYLRFLHFYPSQVKMFAPGTRMRVFGEIRLGYFGNEMIHPRCRVIRGETPLSETLTPVYPTTAGLSQESLRKLVQRGLQVCELAEILPQEVIAELKLLEFETAIHYLHYPPPDISIGDLDRQSYPAWRRIKFDELLAQQLSMRLHRKTRRNSAAPALIAKNYLTQALITALPFSLTKAQRRVLDEIGRDLSCAHPMQRLLQGDVGSGKTIVAALAALQAIENGYQVAVMAPTEILADQHYQKFSAWVVPLGIETAWLSNGLAKKKKRESLEKIAHGRAMLVVGTHALIQDQVEFQNLGLAIVDEQHRFGVHQRLALRLKGSDSRIQPHQLMMSATPIPRTLAMSYYADLDVSVIDELPPGRIPVATKLIADTRRDEVVKRVRDACASGSQCYWVCPLIEESEALQLKTAVDTYQKLSQEFPELKIGLINGRLSSTEKNTVMEAFQRNEIQLLVATTVIEVGVDVPNASLMVIEHAERMGLSQLHQLRGRVGRGSAQSVCILLYQAPLGETARERLKVIYENQDGFEIAKRDLQLRGPGEILGERQSGIPMLRFADINLDTELLDAARRIAARLLEYHPQVVTLHLERWLGDKHQYLRV